MPNYGYRTATPTEETLMEVIETIRKEERERWAAYVEQYGCEDRISNCEHSRDPERVRVCAEIAENMRRHQEPR